MQIQIKNIVQIILFTFCSSIGYSQNTKTDVIKLNNSTSYKLLEPNQDLRKHMILLDQKGNLDNGALNIGFSIIGIANYQNSNRDSKFAYLMRHPTSNNQIGKTASEIVIHSAQLAMYSSVNDWISIYGELLYAPEQSFGSGTITSLGRNQIEFRKGIILISNPTKTPFYLSMGKMDLSFGQMGSYSPFTNSTMWHAFGGLAYTGILGYKKNGLDASVSLIQGGAQFRAANVPVDSTNVPSRINNFATDINYTLDLVNKVKLQLGASYLKGSAYCQPWPIFHFNPCEENNPAYSIYANVQIGGRISLKGAFAKTINIWPGTFNPAPPLNQYEASKVSALDVGGRYTINHKGKTKYHITAEFSNFKAGPTGSPWERQSQLVLGSYAELQNTGRIFIELFQTRGYAPLNFLTGGNFDDPGETQSDRDARSLGIVIGTLITI